MAYTPVTPVDVTPGSNGWNTVDLSSYIPAGASGAAFHYINDNGGSGRGMDFRHPSSTDDFQPDVNPNSHGWGSCGINGSREADIYVEVYTDATIYLVGYYDSDVVFFTNAVSKTVGSYATYVDVDISSDTGADTAVAAILVFHASTAKTVGVRKNGSTDPSWHRNMFYQSRPIIGVDGSEIFEAYLEDSSTNMYLMGYIKSNATLNTNGNDVSVGAYDSWLDVTSALGSGAVAGIYYCIVFNTSYLFGMRKNGSSEDINVRAIGEASWCVVECDGSQLTEYIRDRSGCYCIEFGYFTAAGGTPVSNSILSTIEVLSTINQSKLSLSEALAQCNQSLLSPIEAQSKAMQSQSASSEILARADQSQSSLIESLAIVDQPQSPQMEARGKVLQSRLSSIEAQSELVQSESAVIEVGALASQLQAAGLEAAGAVSVAHLVGYEVLQQVVNAKLTGTECLSSLFAAQLATIESLKDVQGTTIVAYECEGGAASAVSNSVSVPLEALQYIQQNTLTPCESLSSLSTTIIPTIESLSSIKSIEPSAIEVTQQVRQALASPFVVLRGLARSGSGGLECVATMIVSGAGAYEVIEQTSQGIVVTTEALAILQRVVSVPIEAAGVTFAASFQDLELLIYSNKDLEAMITTEINIDGKQ